MCACVRMCLMNHDVWYNSETVTSLLSLRFLWKLISNLILLEFELLKNIGRNSLALSSNLSYRPKNTDKYNISIDDLRF